MSSIAEQINPPPSLWESIREAIRGSGQDFTEGNLGRAILLLSIPMVLEMSMESLFAAVDVFFVAKLGSAATATVGLTEALMVLVYSVAIGLAMSTTAFVARRIGEKDPEAAGVVAMQAVLLGVIGALLFAVPGMLFARELLHLMGAEADVVASGWIYTTVIFSSTFAVMLLFLINAIFRGAGDAVMAMRTLFLANGLNIILDPCLIFGWGPFPELGLKGAAVATLIGRSIGVAFQLSILFGGGRRVQIRRNQVKVTGEVMWHLLRVSLSGMGQFIIAHAAWIGLVRIVAGYGSSALAGYTIAIRIVIVTILPAWGFSNAAATLVGQNLGARKPERAEKSVWLSGFLNMLFLGVIGLAFVIFAEPLVSIFTADPAVIREGATCLRYVSYGYLFYAWGMVIVQAFNGAGDTVTPLIINLFCYWMWQIPIAYSMAKLAGLGPVGVYSAIAVAEGTLAVVGVLVFRRGKWKKQKI
ncbi:MAG: MATE family efflux transporter [bacterium]|nr:MATE family efflux transporter [bacterium]